MNPNNQAPGALPPPGQVPPADTQSPYNFILNAPKPPKKRLLKAGSLRSRLLVLVGGATVIILLIVLVSSLLTRQSTQVNAQLLNLVAEQKEIVRVADLGLAGSTDVATNTFAETAKITVESQEISLTKILVQKKIITKKTKTDTKLDKKVDTAFSAAKIDHRFNEVFKDQLITDLTAYAVDMKKTYKNVHTESIKKILNDGYQTTSSILKN